LLCPPSAIGGADNVEGRTAGEGWKELKGAIEIYNQMVDLMYSVL
jgi:hypothetical protein